MKKSIYSFLLVISSFLTFSPVFAITDPAIKYPDIDLYLEKNSLVWTAPERFIPHDLSTAPTDIAYRKNVLPYEEDRYADIYLVIPQLGLITPIQQIPPQSSDWNSMINGTEISINKYLKGGIIEYASSVRPGHMGKRIDFGHSNFLAADDGRYKTIFANLMRLDAGDEVRYFVRRADDTYGLFSYEITASYPTKPSNVQALLRDKEGADALIFGCYHGLDGRWMIEASYMGEPIPNQGVVEGSQFRDLHMDYKIRIDHAMSLIGKMPMKRRAYHLVRVYKWLEAIQTMGELTTKEQLIIDYISSQVERLYQ